MRYLKKFGFTFLVVLMVAFSCTPAYASEGGSGGDSHIQIDVSGSGITINPGQYPDMGGATNGATPEAAATKIVSKES